MFYVLSICSESGDNYPPMVFGEMPTDEKLEAFLRKAILGEWTEQNDGPGVFGSYLYIEWHHYEKMFVL